MKTVFFQDVPIGEKFCFEYLNQDRDDLWFTRTGDGEYEDDRGQKKDIEDVGSRYSTRVWVRS